MEKQGRRDYYWGHYHKDGAAAKDYAARAADYQRRYGVLKVRQPIAQQMQEAAEQAGDRQSPAPHKRKTPDRGDR